MICNRRRFLKGAVLGGSLVAPGFSPAHFPGVVGAMRGTPIASGGAVSPLQGVQDFSQVPGVVVSHSPARTRIYLSSPSLVILPDGSYRATCDECGPGSTEGSDAVTRVFVSRDRGQAWERLPDVKPAFWSTIFVQRRALYMIGSTNSKNPRLFIRRSQDWGQTWSIPASAADGLLMPDVPVATNAGNILDWNGRIWFGSVFDLLGPHGFPGLGSESRFFVMSAPREADLLKKSSWTCSAPIVFNPTFLQGNFRGLVEGTITIGPEGSPVTLYRVDCREGEKALVAKCDRTGEVLGFDPLRDFINFPGGCKKFIVRYDAVSKLYWSLSDWVPPRHTGYNVERTRNTLALVSSADLHRWTIRTVVLHHPDVSCHAFQYVDFQFDGKDMIALSRTAYEDGLGGAHSQHDSNLITFHRFKNFRKLTPDTAPDGLAEEIRQWNSTA